LFILGIIGLLPFFYVVYVSFNRWDIFGATRGMTWIGADNFRKLVFDTEFLDSLGRSITFTIIVVCIQMVLGFILAQLLMSEFPGRGFFRSVYALPIVVAPIAIGAVWKLLTNPGLGPLPDVLAQFGIDYNIGEPGNQAFITTIVMDTWHWTPFVTLTLLAGLSALPREPVESAMVDGANRFQILLYITIPMLRPVILTTMFLRIMDALRIVDEVWMLTGGGPGSSTRFVGIHIWREVFPKTSYGYGSALSVFLLYFTIVLCWLLVTVITHAEQRRSA